MARGTLRTPQGPHLNERLFRRYEPLIKELCDKYPEPFTFTPTNIQPSTAIVQMRIAIAAVLHHQFLTPIDLNLLADVKLNTEFVQEGKRVTIGSRASRIATTSMSPLEFREEQQGISSERQYLTVETPTVAILNSIAFLITHKVIIDPVIIHRYSFAYTPPDGIYIEPNADGTFTMV